MQRYIEQLIEDLHKATWHMRPPHEIWAESRANPDNELELEDITHVEKYVYGEAISISEITGIAYEQLPPVEKLSQEHQILLAVELEKLLQFFHFHLDFPQNYPSDLKYPFIRKFWLEKHVPLSFGENHIEFCEYDPDDCPFPGYCTTCEEVSEQMKFDEEHGSTENFDFELENLLPDSESIKKFFKNREKLGDNDPETPS